MLLAGLTFFDSSGVMFDPEKEGNIRLGGGVGGDEGVE